MPTHNRFIRDQNGAFSPAGLIQMGAFFPVEIHVPLQIADVLAQGGNPIPAPVAGAALIDTGATITCVHEPVLLQLGLNPIGMVSTGTASGPVQQSTFPGRILFPAQGWQLDLPSVVGVNLTGQQIRTNPSQPVIALLGRDFLQQFVLIWNGPGGFWTIAGR